MGNKVEINLKWTLDEKMISSVFTKIKVLQKINEIYTFERNSTNQ